VYSCYSHNTINNKPPATKRLALDGSRYTRGNAGTHFSKRRKSRPGGGQSKARISFQMQTEHALRTMGVPRWPHFSCCGRTARLGRHAGFIHSVPSEVMFFDQAVDLCDAITRCLKSQHYNGSTDTVSKVTKW